MPQWQLVAPVHAGAQPKVRRRVQVQARPGRFTACGAGVPGQALQRLGRVLEVPAEYGCIRQIITRRAASTAYWPLCNLVLHAQ